MDKLEPEVLQIVAKYLNLRELFACFEPICRKTKGVVNELCRQVKSLNLGDFHSMSDEDFIHLARRCCNVTFLSLDYSSKMIICNQDFWELNIYCPKLQIVVIHGSPLYAHEFGDEIVARLAGIDGSIPFIFHDEPIVTPFHIFCSARIVYLANVFNFRGSVIVTRMWSLMRYILSLDKIKRALPFLSLDQLIVCAFYVICLIHGNRVTFHNLLDVYSLYLQPFQNLSDIIVWGNVNHLWFGIDLTLASHTQSGDNKTMVEFYNEFFVPIVYPVIQQFQALIHNQQLTGKKVSD